MNRIFAALIAVVAIAGIAGVASADANLKGSIKIDGSSTVYPITEAIAEEFMAENPNVRVTVGVSGTGGGFKKFSAGETDVSDASRPVKEKEIQAMQGNGIDFIELPVAFDGIAVCVSADNSFIDYLTTEELKRMWEPEADGKVTHWNQIRSSFPNKPIKLYGPGTDSGTFDYFTKAINGEERACRSDFTGSEDDNVLVQGIAGNTNAIGYFGFAYLMENMDILRAVPIKHEGKTVSPSMDTINNGTYAPLSRPIFIYVSTVSMDRAEVDEFIHYYLENAADIVPDVGYVPLPEEIYELGIEQFEDGVTGSIFHGSGANLDAKATLYDKMEAKQS